MIPCLGVLILNRGDLLTRLVNSIDYPIEKLCIVQNSNDTDVIEAIAQITSRSHKWIKSVYVERPFRNIGVAPAWNNIIKTFSECDYWLIANNDTLFLPGDLEKFHNLHSQYPTSVITAPNGSFSCFLLDSTVINKVGLFDENIWPIYNEDSDYMIRMARANVELIRIDSDIGESDNGSWTIRSSDTYRKASSATEHNNQLYLLDKWGKSREFITPYNAADRTLRDWQYDPLRRNHHNKAWNNMENTANKFSLTTTSDDNLRLSEIIDKYSLITDKNSNHSYCDYFYEIEFAKYRDKPIQLVEIGIAEGGSLLLWAEYFKKGKILGVDLVLRGDCEKNCSKYPNIMFALGNAYMFESLANFPPIDIFIDDGPHSLDSQLWSVKNILPKIKPGGLFVIEDIDKFEYVDELMASVPFHLKAHAEIIDLRHVKGRWDDLMLVVRIPELDTKLITDLPGTNSTIPTTIDTNNLSAKNLPYTDLIKSPTGLSMDMMAERLSHLVPIIDFSEVKTIVDVGAAHGYESLNMARVFTNAIVHGFEPTPEHFTYCVKHYDTLADNLRNRITIDNLALNNVDGPISFYPLDEKTAQSNNTGVASKYQFINPNVFPHELNLQKKITVGAAKLDTMCAIRGLQPDIIWMDAQGSELDILKGAENTLRGVKVILTEAGVKPYYHGQSLKPEIDAYLESQGFVELVSGRKLSHEYEVDTIYVRREMLG